MAKFRALKHHHDQTMTFARGDVLDLTDDLAAWLLRDSPGCIEPVGPSLPKPIPDDVPVKAIVRAVDEPEHDRMVKAAPTRRVVHKPAKAAQDGE